MTEVSIRIPAAGRSLAVLIADLRRALDGIAAGEHAEKVRVEEWWDEEDPDVWVRMVEGPRARWRVRVTDAGYEVLLRGSFTVRLFRPAPLKALVALLTRGRP